ncbi:hypothetical protein BUE65_22470 [Klebsiella variicola]|uniref:glycosyltransferase n=1 Tax=Klebsiella variicola TaxID=244366 RepID=UPI000B52A356|nr:glycosyltransferase [Klebsiella variicola]OWW13466.1 hypothetical protein BUE65_22470 [Klebsiella variicola]
MFKILRVITSMDPQKGGPSEGIRQLQQEIHRQRLNIKCDIVCMDDLSEEAKDVEYASIYAVGKGKGVYSYSESLKNWLEENVKKYDFVIIHGIWQYHSYIASKLCIKNSIPYFLYTHGMLDPWFKKNYPLKHIKKMLYWTLIERKVVNNAEAVIFTSEEEKILARQSFPFYEPKEFVTAYGTSGSIFDKEIARSEFYKKFPFLKGKKILLYMGRIHEKKGCDILIKSYAKISKEHNDYHLFIAGPDTSAYAKTLKDLVSSLNLNNKVTWGGMLSGDVKWGAYYSSEIFCLASHQENFGIVVAEALSCEIPVVTTTKVNIWREIERADAGMIAIDNDDSFTEILNEFLKKYENDRERLRGNALRCFKENFDIKLVATSFNNLISSER